MLVAVFLTVTGDAKAGLSGWNAAISADNPLNWYRFDEASGTSCADSGSDGLDGTYDGAILNQEGRFGAGTAVRFDGSGNNRVTFGSPSHLTGSWTVEYIVRKIGSASQALHDDTTTSIRLVQWGTNGVVGFTRYGVRDYTFNAQPGQDLILPTGQWVHLAFRKNSAGTQVFIDGVLAGTTTDSVDFPRRQIGAGGTGRSDQLIAFLDEAVVFDRALTDQQIADHYEAITGSSTTAHNPSPPNDATNVPATTAFGWDAPITGSVDSYTLYYRASDADFTATGTTVIADLDVATYTPPRGLDYATTYYWRVDVLSGGQTHTADVWNFKTGGKAANPSPADGAQDVATPTALLGWTGDTFATSYKVHFGAGLPLPTVPVYTGSDTQCTVETPRGLTTYYWRVDEYVDGVLALSGDIWRFTTREKPPECPRGDLNWDCKVDAADLDKLAELWLDDAGSMADLIGTDGVNGADLAVLGNNWLTQVTSDVVINEIHHNPDIKTELVEFVELYNTGPADVDISGWHFCDGISYEFPQGTILRAGEYVVIAEDPGLAVNPTTIADKYGVDPALLYGFFVGTLSNEGEKIELCDALGRQVDQVDYKLGFPWPIVGDPVPESLPGNGHSMQLIHHKLDNDLGGSWRSALPTPGAENTEVFAGNIPPHIRQVKHQPKQPASGETVTITAKVTDPDGVASVILQYQIIEPGHYIRYQYSDGNNKRLPDPEYETGWVDVPMHDDGVKGDLTAGDDTYSVAIPAAVQAHRRLIRYRITVGDTGGRSLRVPYADDPQPNFAYFVYDGAPSWSGADRPGHTPVNEYGTDVVRSLPIYHLIARNEDVEECQYVYISNYNAASQWYQWTGALVYDGEVYDHVWFRNRGWWSTYAWGKNKWKFDFSRGHYFQARDDYGRKYKETWDKLNFSACFQQAGGASRNRGEQGMFEAVTFKLFNLAGVPACNTNWFHFRVIDDEREAGPTQYDGDFWGLYMAIEQPDGRFLNEHNLPDGNFYKMFFVLSGDRGNKNNQGPTQVSNHSDVEEFCRWYHGYPDSLDEWQQRTNLDNYYSYRAIVDATHHYDLTDRWNCMYYHAPQTDKWSVLPWDVDLSWDNAIYTHDDEYWKQVFESRLFPIAANPSKYHNFTQCTLAFQNRMRELRDLLLNDEQCRQLIDEYAAVIEDPQGGPSFVDADRAMWDRHPRNQHPGIFYQAASTRDFEGMVLRMKQFIAPGGWGGNRINSIIADTAIPDTPTISYFGPPGYAINTLVFRASPFSDPQGLRTFAALKWRIAEVTDESNPTYDPADPRKYEIETVWESGELTVPQYDIRIPGNAVKERRTYRVRCKMKDTSGRWSHWSNPDQFVAGEPISAHVLDDLRITEVMYNPAEADTSKLELNVDNDEFEYIELKNTGENVLDLTNVSFVQGIKFYFYGSSVTSLGPGQFVLVVRNRAAFESRYGMGLSGIIAGQYINYDTKLDNSGETVKVADLWNGTIAEFSYSDGRGWPLPADGSGHSLVPLSSAIAAEPDGSLDYGGNWRDSAYIGGSPGRDDPEPAHAVVLNEVMAHTDYSDPAHPEHDSDDWIELCNTTGTTRNLGGWYLSDDKDEPGKWAIPPVNVSGNGRVSFNEVTHFHNPISMGFGLNKAGDEVLLSYLPGTSEDRVVDYVRFKGEENFVSLGRYPDGGGYWIHMYPSRDLPNTAGTPDIVIDELMYHPVDPNEEYVELYNPTPVRIYLENAVATWRLDDEDTFGYPFDPGTYMEANGRLVVVGFDPVTETGRLNAFIAAYGTGPLAPGVNIVGPLPGNLSNGGERLALKRPQAPDEPGDAVSWVVVDEVIYSDISPWPVEPDGTGAVLQRIHSDGSHSGNDPSNWHEAPPSPAAMPLQ